LGEGTRTSKERKARSLAGFCDEDLDWKCNPGQCEYHTKIFKINPVEKRGLKIWWVSALG
jgi:hypothetical protein